MSSKDHVLTAEGGRGNWTHLRFVPVRARLVLHQLHAAVGQKYVVRAGCEVILPLLVVPEIQAHSIVLHVV